MVTVIKSGASKKSIETSIKKLSSSKKKEFDANKFCGVIKLNEEPLDIQKRLRDEWK